MLPVEHRRTLFASSSAGVTPSNADFEYACRQRRSLLLAMKAAQRDGNAIVYVHTRREADALARIFLSTMRCTTLRRATTSQGF